MNRTMFLLKKAGLKYNKEVLRTVINFEKRGVQIKKFLEDKYNYEFLIIDDEMHDFEELFAKENILKTDVMKGALSLKMVNDFLDKNIKRIKKWYKGFFFVV